MLITAFYHFTPLDEARTRALAERLEAHAARSGLRGLILLGTEGINLTASGSEDAISGLKTILIDEFKPASTAFKDSRADKQPFREFKIKLRAEIVTLGRPDLVPAGPRRHLTPREWHEMMARPDVTVLDTRNSYEIDLGKFKGAVDFETREFREFPEKLKASKIPKDKPVMIYCTGGIRCEKAILELEEQGYQDVHQLDGGILAYLEQFPEQRFEGECFVFDYRVAVDQHLNPTKAYSFCPHCGQPANRELSCVQCGETATLCVTCEKDEPTCSKNCAHHRAINSNSSRTHEGERAKRRRAGEETQSGSSSAPGGG